jgi:2-polyprenyl-6-methoxyphenol hydroxylase-like FAD-dependent oxidoreductase
MENPVLIIGAGPVGMTLALELARYGVAVRIIDKAAQRTDKSKALVLWSRTLELLDRGGGSAPFIDAGFKVLAANIVAGADTIGRLSMATVHSPYAFALMLPQSDTERLLDEQLGRQGVVVEREVELARFQDEGCAVTAVLKHADGQEETVTTPWLIGCDGAHSTVRHGLNASFVGETLDSDWILADVHLQGYPWPDSEMSIYWHRDGVLVFFPISPGRFRVVADLASSGADHPPSPTLEQVQEIVTRRGPPGLEAHDPVWLSGFRINGRKVADYRRGRVFLAGDAAHVHSPAGGQGMNTGMQDAFNLAWKLAMVIQGNAGDRLLDSYSPERSEVGDHVVKAADRMTEIGTLRNPVMQTLRNLVGRVVMGFTPFQQAMADTMSEISIGYRDSPLNGPGLKGRSGLKPGDRFPPVVGQGPIGSGAKPRFALVGERNAGVAPLLARFDAVLAPDIHPAPADTQGLWLIRPDGYVVCGSNDPDVIGGHLQSILGSQPRL